jgi:glucosylceramidase
MKRGGTDGENQKPEETSSSSQPWAQPPQHFPGIALCCGPSCPPKSSPRSRRARIAWLPASRSSGARERTVGEAIRLDPSQKFQPILGFGAAFTDAACYNFHQLSPTVREQLFHELFHPSELGLSPGHICVGSSDYSTQAYSYDDGDPDPELKRFSIAHGRAHILPLLRQARAVNPDLFLFSSPSSRPGWMKTGGSLSGGSLRKSSYASYAQYLRKFLEAYRSEGAPIQATTVQNEVDADPDGRMPACLWGQKYELEFVRDHLGPLLEQNQIDTKIWILDRNYNLWGRVLDQLDDSRFREYVDAVAWHGYGGKAELASRVHDASPSVANALDRRRP